MSDESTQKLVVEFAMWFPALEKPAFCVVFGISASLIGTMVKQLTQSTSETSILESSGMFVELRSGSNP